MDLKLEKLIDKKHSLFICEDKEGINTGFFIVPCRLSTFDILQDWYNRTEFIDHVWWDNKAAHEWAKETTEKIKILPKYMNHYIDEVNDQTKIIHMAGCTNNHRAGYFKSKKELSLLT